VRLRQGRWDEAFSTLVETFQSVTRTRKNLQLVLITLNGLKPNIWSKGLVDVSLSAEEIFGSLQ
jgi:hypothetical protein